MNDVERLILRMGDFQIGKDGKRMILVSAGYFTMGSTVGNDGMPAHCVYLDSFYIDETPVTNAEYTCFLDANPDYPAPPGWDKKRRTFPPRKAEHPAVNLSWDHANAYARWAGKQLPTEVQWEKSARGIDGRRYPWGERFDPMRCNTWESGARDTAPVTAFAPRGNSPYGVMDMAGNVWEWCADWYAADYYEHSPSRNPAGPTDGILRVLRGGAWSSDAANKRAAHRGFYCPRYSNVLVGFRCVKNV